MINLWDGKSDSVRNDQDTLGWELLSWKASRKGDWKATWLSEPFGQSEWQLYNIKDDPGEAEDLSSKDRKKVKSLIEIYEEYAKDNGVVEITFDVDM